MSESCDYEKSVNVKPLFVLFIYFFFFLFFFLFLSVTIFLEICINLTFFKRMGWWKAYFEKFKGRDDVPLIQEVNPAFRALSATKVKDPLAMHDPEQRKKKIWSGLVVIFE